MQVLLQMLLVELELELELELVLLVLVLVLLLLLTAARWLRMLSRVRGRGCRRAAPRRTACCTGGQPRQRRCPSASTTGVAHS